MKNLDSNLESALILARQELENGIKNSDSDKLGSSLLTKLLIEEILKNTFEDDCIKIDVSNIFIKAVKDFLEDIRDDEHLKTIGNYFKELVKSKQKTFTLIHKITNKKSLIVSYSTNSNLFKYQGKELPIFVNFDLNMSIPRTARIISKWFLNTIESLKKFYSKKGIDLNGLLFIEKPYSSVGALSLMSSLVSELNITATILRPSYIGKESLVSGGYPTSYHNYCIIFDTLTTAEEIKEYAKLLKENYDANILCGSVLFYFDNIGNFKRIRTSRNEIYLDDLLIKYYAKFSDISKEVFDAHKDFKNL